MTTTLAILAGGEGRRMGRPKAELRVGDQPILAYLLDRFNWDGPTLLVTAPGRERPPGADRFAQELSDPTSGEGPLRGVVTAMEAVSSELLIVTTCDMPLVGKEQLLWLDAELSRRPEAQLIMLTRGLQLEPFPLAIRDSARHVASRHYAQGARGVRSLAALDGAVVLAAPEDWLPEVWTNLNTPEDLDLFSGRVVIG
jgi:molybdenum cofactor guanylyltransferase